MPMLPERVRRLHEVGQVLLEGKLCIRICWLRFVIRFTNHFNPREHRVRRLRSQHGPCSRPLRCEASQARADALLRSVSCLRK